MVLHNCVLVRVGWDVDDMGIIRDVWIWKVVVDVVYDR